jgi:multicomponent Na+:H+ antiporter subunit B
VTVLFGMFLLTLLVITAIGIVRSRNLFSAVMLSGIFSLLMAINFFVLDAADVALTEAAVGAGVATVLLLGALALTSDPGTPRVRVIAGCRWRWWPANAGRALRHLEQAVLRRPRGAGAPARGAVVPGEDPEYIDIPNVVTAVLASFRGYDTLGEVFVIHRRHRRAVPAEHRWRPGSPNTREPDALGIGLRIT